MSVSVKDNTQQILAMINANKERALTAMGTEAAGAVKSYMEANKIRITGTLMGSINSGLSSEDSVDVGTNVEYAKWVHDGHYQPPGLHFKGEDGQWHTTHGGHVAGKPFITNGINGAWDRIQKVAEQELKRGF